MPKRRSRPIRRAGGPRGRRTCAGGGRRACDRNSLPRCPQESRLPGGRGGRRDLGTGVVRPAPRSNSRGDQRCCHAFHGRSCPHPSHPASRSEPARVDCDRNNGGDSLAGSGRIPAGGIKSESLHAGRAAGGFAAEAVRRGITSLTGAGRSAVRLRFRPTLRGKVVAWEIFSYRRSLRQVHGNFPHQSKSFVWNAMH